MNQTLMSPISEDGNKTPTTDHTNPKEASPAEPSSPTPHQETPHIKQVPVTTKALKGTSTAAIPGVATSLSSTDENVTLDIWWTVLSFAISSLFSSPTVYTLKLGLGWFDVVK